jgi:hypothetical protein
VHGVRQSIKLLVGALGRLRFAAEIGGRGLNMNFGLRKVGLTYRSERSIGPTGESGYGLFD